MSFSRRPLFGLTLCMFAAGASACGEREDNSRIIIIQGPDSGPDGGGADEDGGGLLDGGPLADAGSASDTGFFDLGVDAGGTFDAGDPDDSGSPVDSGPPGTDSGVIDSGTPDGGTPDGGMPDGGTPDAGARDAGPRPDSGVTPPACDPGFGAANGCGGNVVGSWVYVDGCTDTLFNRGLQFCPTMTYSNDVHTVSGDLTFIGSATAGIFTRNLHALATAQVQVPQSCLVVGDCATIGALLPVLFPGATGTCATTASGCDCDVTVDLMANDTGTYSVSGGVLTATPQGEAARHYDFCVNNGALVYKGDANTTTDNDYTYVLIP